MVVFVVNFAQKIIITLFIIALTEIAKNEILDDL